MKYTVLLLVGVFALCTTGTAPAADLRAGFGVVDITPPLGDKPVYMAGFGNNRKATRVHDPLMARAVVLQHQNEKLALVSLDIVGFFHPNVAQARKRLPGFRYVLITSTHNHEGPDTLGLWGPDRLRSGVDQAYMKQIEDGIVRAVQTAEQALQPASARIGTARAPELLHDGREPYIKHDELVAIEFLSGQGQRAGIVVQWNCHPETLGSRNTELSADYVGYTVKQLQERYHCPVVYLTGTVGGLMTSLHVEITNEQGKKLDDGTYEKTERYGRRVAQAAEQALAKAGPVQLTPFQVRSRDVFIPMVNKFYLLGRQMGVLNRPAFLWTGDIYRAEPLAETTSSRPLCMRTEVAWLRLGDLDVAAIPGEIYPELVLGQVQDPPDSNADFPDAAIEPAIYQQLRGPYRMLIGLANDEIGYIIPKRQWDEKPPFCYGRTKTQYGEVNSVGPDTAPILCRAFRELVQGKK
jgi:hypothetical protein